MRNPLKGLPGKVIFPSAATLAVAFFAFQVFIALHPGNQPSLNIPTPSGQVLFNTPSESINNDQPHPDLPEDLSKNERSAWAVWKATFESLNTDRNRRHGATAESWLPKLLEERQKIKDIGSKTPLVYVLAADADQRFQDLGYMRSMVQGSREEQIIQLKKIANAQVKWMDCFNDMREYAR